MLAAIVADLHAQRPDHIAVTGDLVNLSLDTEFARAARWLDALGKPHDVTLVPGNHDAYVRHVRRSCRAALGRFHARRRRCGLSLRAAARAAGADRALHIAADRAVHGDRPACGDQLARLAEILITLAREPVFRVVLIHHPPIPNRGHHMKRLIDAPILRAMLAEHGAELLLHGHNHEQQLMWLDGPKGRIPAVGVPSASAIVSTHDEPAAYNMYRIGGEPGAWQCEMVVRGFAFGRDGVSELKRQTLR